MSVLDQISKIEEEAAKKIESLKEEALKELKTRKSKLQTDLDEVIAQIENLTGKKSGGTKRSRMSKIEVELVVQKAVDSLSKTKAAAQSKAEIVEKIGIAETAWQTVSKILKKNHKLKMVGTKKDAKYYLGA